MWKLAIAIMLAVAVGVDIFCQAKMHPGTKTKLLAYIYKNIDRQWEIEHAKPTVISFQAPCTNQAGANSGEVLNCSWSYAVDKFDFVPNTQLHNGLRFKVSLGLEWHSPAGYQPGGEMDSLTASGELAGKASQMAISCIKDPGSCKEVPQGFNIYDGVATKKRSYYKWSDAFNHWYSGVTKYNYTTQFKSNPDTDSYTQMIWANTHSIGCASIKYTQKKPKLRSRRIQVCAYDPPGNIEGQGVYTEHTEKSRVCPKN